MSGIRWRQRSGRRPAAGGAVLALIALAGCGEDDQESIEESLDDAVTQVSDAATEASDVLSTVVDSIDDVTDTVADEVDDAVTEVSDAVDDMTDDSGSDTTALPDGPPPVNPCAAGESGGLGGEGPAPAPDATEIEVIAREFVLDGLEAIDSTGEFALTLTNTGSELHEVVMVRIDDDETRPLEELLMEEDPSAFATDVAPRVPARASRRRPCRCRSTSRAAMSPCASSRWAPPRRPRPRISRRWARPTRWKGWSPRSR
ncbi:MAG: hypothetical protein R2713_03330 [Ilumatobacteraceae bacterium]